MALYQPPTRVATLQIPYAALVNQADPDWAPGKHRELAYVFSGRFFFYDPYNSGPYAPYTNVADDSNTIQITDDSGTIFVTVK